jgi:uncharacterized membrane protein YcaP (DUF421 family)
MKPEEIKITDFGRILLGEVPTSFLIECVIRVLFLYLLIIVSMRLMGKRMAAQLSRIEMAALVALAAAVGVPVQAPDRGLLPPFIIAVVIIAIERLIAALSARNKRFESLTQDSMSIVVKDGRFQWESMETAVLTKECLVSQLRSEGIDNLGKVQRTYMEANGSCGTFQYPDKRPGLSLIPEWDLESFDQEKAPGMFACAKCGAVKEGERKPSKECPYCGSSV